MRWARRGGRKSDSELSRVNPRLKNKRVHKRIKSVGAKFSEKKDLARKTNFG